MADTFPLRSSSRSNDSAGYQARGWNRPIAKGARSGQALNTSVEHSRPIETGASASHGVSPS
ncbi:hypothetical protein BVIET440_40041 [Burkholderia vietnamiensis]|nr:hypothetical protein BVI2075_310048 [Burkholderia vietnamiensis]